jgi:hypothetical protein
MLSPMTTPVTPAQTYGPWPTVPWRDWGETLATVHIWTQIVVKVRMAKSPAMNHWWHVALYVSARGLTTGPMPHGPRLFEIELDFAGHRLAVVDSDGRTFGFDLEPMSVATFHRRLLAGLRAMDIDVRIWPHPVEVSEAIPFEEDERHATYDRAHVSALFHRLTYAQRLLSQFRGEFIGNASPVHFFWGGFDLAVSRFSGRTAPRHRGGVANCPDWVMWEAYSHEVSSAGWWPLSPDLGPSFYSYTYPQPPGFEGARIGPVISHFNHEYSEFVMRDEDISTCPDPGRAILEFLQTSCEAGADHAGWDRVALEAPDLADGRGRPPHILFGR